MTVTSKLAGAEVLLAWSFAVQETVVVPTAKVAPEFLLHVIVGDESTASVAVTVYVTTALEPTAGTVIGPGTERVGAVVS